MKRFLLGCLAFAAVVIFIANAMQTQEAGASDIRRETVFMSRGCADGWYIESKDGNKLVLACNQYGGDDE